MEQTQKTTTAQKRKRLSSDILLTSLKTYRQFVKETGRKDITYSQYSKTIKKVHEKAMHKVLEGTYNVKFPSLGLLYLNSFRGSYISFPDTNKYGKVVRKKNHITNGKVYTIRFRTHYSGLPWLRYFNFVATRVHKMLFHKMIMQNEVPEL